MRLYFMYGFPFFIVQNVIADCFFDDYICYALSQANFQPQFQAVSLVFMGLIFSAVIIYALIVVFQFSTFSFQKKDKLNKKPEEEYIFLGDLNQKVIKEQRFEYYDKYLKDNFDELDNYSDKKEDKSYE